MRRHALLAICLLVFSLTALAGAADVTFRITNREVYLGGSTRIEITISNARDFTPPAIPDIDGARIRLLPGDRTMTSTSIINGQATTTTSTTLVYEVTPQRAGRITIPALSVDADGRTFESPPTVIVANESDNGDILFVDVVASSLAPGESAFVGESVPLTLRIWLRPFRSPELNVVLSEGDMWSLVDTEKSKFGIFAQRLNELSQQRQRPVGREELRGDRSYYVYEITRDYRASHAGPPELNDISVVVNWPTGLERVRDFFNAQSLRLQGIRPVVASASAEGLDFRALPADGRPDSFNGAVGDFGLVAAAKPTDVAVGDPITLSLSVTVAPGGDADALEGVQAPPLARIPEITSSFRVPDEQLAGTMGGRRKLFTQTLRPLSADVTEVPPIPFAFFDPSTGEYRTVYSKPIPIHVSPAERLNLSQIVGATPSGASGSGLAPPPTSLTTVVGGLRANAPITTALLRDDRAGYGVGTAAVILIPPAAAIALAVARRRRDAVRSDPARQRAARAMRVALDGLRDRSPDSVAAAVAGFVADRCGLPEGSRTCADIARELRERGANPELIERVERLLGTCERARYAPSGSEAISVDEARAVVAALDRSPALARRARVGGATQ